MRRVALVLLAGIVLGAVLPGCPFFTRRDREASGGGAPAEAAH